MSTSRLFLAAALAALHSSSSPSLRGDVFTCLPAEKPKARNKRHQKERDRRNLLKERSSPNKRHRRT